MKHKIGMILVLVLFAVHSPSFADPVSKAPHRGALQDAEGMHAELVIEKSGLVKVYLYDNAMKPLSLGYLQGRLVIKAHDGAEHNKDLKASKEGKEGTMLQGDPLKGLSDWDTVVVSVKVKGQWVHFCFSHPHDAKASH